MADIRRAMADVGVGLGIPIPPALVDGLAQAVAERAGELIREQARQQATPWMTVEEAAEYLRTPLGTLRDQTRRNLVPCRKEGRRLYYHRGELDRWRLNRAA